jgi:hypothetical protein
MTDEGLQFEKAEFADAGAQGAATCGYCQQDLRHNYWSVNGKPACLRCKNEIATRGTEGSGFGRFVRATVFGGFAGAAGAGIWYAIRAVTNMEIGLISILVGLAVGVAVKAGSHGRGGPLYQALAMFLTYTAICSTYVPYIVEGLREKWSEEGKATAASPSEPAAPIDAAAPAPSVPSAGEDPASSVATASEEPVSAGQAVAALVLLPIFVMAFAYAAPFLGGFENIIGIAIIAFGVYEAWKINRRETPAISGPHAVARPATTPAPMAAALGDTGSSSGG